jgi:hypothetical protein
VKHDWELDQAKWQKDSYWRYHLIKLLEQKQAAVTEAVNQARSDFAAAMVAEEDESTATRGDQRQALADFSTATHQALVDAVAEDRDNLVAEIDERDSTLTAFLDEQLATIRADVQAEVDSFVDSMKTLYNYADIPQYNVEENLQIVPYTEYQHRNFLHKFGFWLDGQLSGLDARIEQMVIDTTAQVASITDAADVQGGHLETDNIVQREISEDFLATKAAELLITTKSLRTSSSKSSRMPEMPLSNSPLSRLRNSRSRSSTLPMSSDMPTHTATVTSCQRDPTASPVLMSSTVLPTAISSQQVSSTDTDTAMPRP